MVQALQEIMNSYEKYPPRPLQSYLYTGPISIDKFRRVQQLRELLKQQQLELPPLTPQE